MQPKLLMLPAAAAALSIGPLALPHTRATTPIMQAVDTRLGVTPGVAAASSAGSVVPTRTASDSTILVQGGSLRTWSYRSPSVEQVQVVLSTEGRPLDADIELWHGPDNTWVAWLALMLVLTLILT